MNTNETPIERRWSPYVGNGGTVAGIAGANYCIVAGDSRLSERYSIHSRNVTKLQALSSKSVLGTAGMCAEAATLWKVLHYKCTFYKHNHRKEMATPSVAQMLSNTLYYKRFFPYYAMNCLGGVDEEGKGAVYSYDSIGSFERRSYGVTGTARELIMSLLDNQVDFKTQKQNKVPLDVDDALDLMKDVFNGAAERDIYTGDAIDIAIITSEGIKWEKAELRRD